MLAPVGTDNCGIATTVQIAGLASGIAFPVGTTTNTFEVTDAAGNTSTCSFDVIVVDSDGTSNKLYIGYHSGYRFKRM